MTRNPSGVWEKKNQFWTAHNSWAFVGPKKNHGGRQRQPPWFSFGQISLLFCQNRVLVGKFISVCRKIWLEMKHCLLRVCYPFSLPCIGTSRPLGCSVHSSDTRPFAAAGILDIHFFNLRYDKFCNTNFPISKQKHPTIK